VLSIDKENILDICYKLNLDEGSTYQCKYYNYVFSSRIPGHSTHCILAGAIYFVTQSNGLNISKKNISDATGISAVTINKIYKKIMLLSQI
jgi:transcription initiation factor TFIIIB Brf1 subunit/transcription initiation factor TFIIB